MKCPKCEDPYHVVEVCVILATVEIDSNNSIRVIDYNKEKHLQYCCHDCGHTWVDESELDDD